MNLKPTRNSLTKKAAAVCMAAALGITAVPAPVLAESSYQETEKAALTKAIEDFAKSYSVSLKEYDALKDGVKADISLTLDDAGRSLLAFMVPTDISWFNEMKLSSDISMAEGSQIMSTGLFLNDTKICTLNYYFDLENMNIYMEIPELREGYIKVNYTETMAAQEAMIEEQAAALEEQSEALDEQADTSEDTDSAEAFDTEAYNAFMKEYMAIVSDLPAFMPESDVIEELLNKYGTILLDHTTELPAAQETLTLGSISQECTVYEGQLTGTAATEMAQEILDTAKTDETLQTLLESWDEQLPDTKNLYQSFLDAIEEGTEELAEAESDDTSYIASKVYVTEDGEITGRLLSTCEGDTVTPIISWQTLKNGDAFEYLFSIGADDEVVSLTGNGQITDGKLNGTYELSDNDTPVAAVEVTNYDTESEKEGRLNGSYKVTLIADETDESSVSLQNFALLMDIADAGTTGTIDMSLTSAGSSLGHLIMESSMDGAAVEAPAADALTNAYDAMDENAMNEYMTTVTLDTVLENLTSAGVPQELITQLLSGGTDTSSGEIADESAE